LNVAIEHRLMHCETLAYMLHRLPLEQKLRPTSAPVASSRDPLHPGMIEIPAGPAALGLSSSSGIFGVGGNSGSLRSIGGIVSALWGREIVDAYLRWAGF